MLHRQGGCYFDGKRLRDDDVDGNDDDGVGFYVAAGGGVDEEEDEYNKEEDGNSCYGDGDDVMINFPGRRE